MVTGSFHYSTLGAYRVDMTADPEWAARVLAYFGISWPRIFDWAKECPADLIRRRTWPPVVGEGRGHIMQSPDELPRARAHRPNA